ncbi:DUF2946 domain-containing protein [Acinetobacter baumannii]|uniref:DUF2946 domain-containing protein n=1 Tax=Acinetobacter baumannii TaxID=470 RepID=UPI00112A4B88|nr:DUF2946 domain-containing protein [Acinetobacter baumannii]MBP4340819.1 DUF2946 domain-containing protein [Acinetobacter baumannii]MBP4576355.1 DUF2946 domain-containing protein [Acinetobacter baumannii]MBP4844974.1 DUF2946 domain-containing protein [Acinetobacter baumannii]MDH2526243.1 DUF2946 domain-containing protein [Acinetobacter baumannii]MDO7454034.1 DUF2946 domain-containing protein [Acinetobacter baumannii]
MVFGRLLGLYAVLLQIAVFLQPLLPEEYQISPVCETIAQALQLPHSVVSPSHDHHSTSEQQYSMSHHMQHAAHASSSDITASHHHHDAGHQCQYCVVYSHVVPLPDIDLEQILIRIQVRFLAFIENYFHVFFQLQQLFLIPQGRAPPL